MIVLFDQSFSKSLDKLKDNLIKERLKTLIVLLENTDDLSKLSALKAMKGHPGYFRFRIGNYRLGFELTANNEILLILVAHRKDIYKRFP